MNFGQGKIGGKYAVGPKFGSGSFGQVYLVNNFGTEQIYALKKEDQKAKHLQLMSEAKILKSIQGIGFPKVHWQGNQYKSNLMVLDLLGPSIEDLYMMCNKKLNLKTTLMLADQFLQRIQWLHSKDYIHRDIKPQNFLMGLGKNSHIVHLIDFGLSKKYRDPKTHQHIPYKQNKNLTGTARYASVNSHLGIEQSRRDDLQSIGYMLIYLVQGYLPWQGVRANNKMQKYQKIMEKKLSIPAQIQCKHLPIQFSIFINYCRSLKFQDKPNYSYLRSLFLDLMDREGITYDYNYDWCFLNEERQINNCLKIEIRKPIDENEIEDLGDEQGKENLSGESLDSGQENIIDEDFDHSQKGFSNKNDKNLIDMQEKKNKLLYQ